MLTLCKGLVLMTGPFQTVLAQIPKGVLAGLFLYMGTDAVWTSGVTAIFLYLIKDRYITSPTDPFHQVRKSRLWAWLLFELLGFAATFAITNTIAAIVSLVMSLEDGAIAKTKFPGIPGRYCVIDTIPRLDCTQTLLFLFRRTGHS